MKKTILLGLVCMLAITISCKKHKEENGCGETPLKVTTSPADGTTDPPAPGTTFPLVVTIADGAVPSAGVTIYVTARKDSTNSTPFFTDTRVVTMNTTTYSITGAPAGSVCIVETVVSSKSCNTNQWKGMYRFSSK